MKRTHLLGGTLVLALLFGSACNNGHTGNENMEDTTYGEENNAMGTVSDNDRDFAREAAMGGMMEVELGRLAENNASSSEVKDFGRMMVDDHSKANDQLKSLAMNKNIDIPTALSQDKQDKVDKLREKTGSDFDKDYMDLMVSDHKEDIDKFQKEANNGDDADLKQWANSTLPTLQQHLDRAQQIKDNLK